MKMNRREWVVGLVTNIVGDKPTAEMVVERLLEENVLVLGYGNADVEKVVQAFQDTFGTTKVTQKDRFAANRLVSKYGTQSIVGIISLLATNSTEKYAPVVGSVAQLEDKLVSVLSFLRNIKGTETIDA